MTRAVPSKNTRCQFGIAVRDVTGHAGMYMRWWGAANHDVADGVHRPSTATAAIIAPLDGDGPELALVALDYCSFMGPDDERVLRQTVRERTGIAEEAFILNCAHQHSTVNAGSQIADKPGGEFGAAYRARLADAITDAVREAREQRASAWITYGQGRCNLAVNRDFWDAEVSRWACGYNPDAPADDTVLVARVTGDDGTVRAILFNYACHPTTLAWDNHLLSPDYVGAAREVLERAFGAPALFMQGASGDLAPRVGYVGDTAIADRNGRQLGYAAASAIEAIPPAGMTYAYTGIVVSGADIGTWAYEPSGADDLHGASRLAARMEGVPLAIKEIPPAAELEAQLAAATERAEGEKLHRRLGLRRTLGETETHTMPLWFWRLGDAVLVGISEEPYSILQQTLRRSFPDTPIFVLGVTNGSLGYLCPRETYGTGRYQEIQSPYQPGCLEATIEATIHGITAVLTD
jgi:neutral/alkaline ceramidase-like enzyme